MDTYARPEQAAYTEHVYQTIEMEVTTNLRSEHTYEMTKEDTAVNPSFDFHWVNWFAMILSSTSMALALGTFILVLYPSLPWYRSEQLSNENLCHFPEYILVSHIASLLQKMKDKQDQQEKHKSQYTAPRDQFGPVAFHKRVLPPSRLIDSYDSNHQIVTFNAKDHDNRTEHVHGVVVLDDRIQIKYSGFYYIYSSVHFRPSTTEARENDHNKLLYMSVHKERLNHPMHLGQILKAIYTCDLVCSQRQHSSYTGGVFHIRAGDILQVCLSTLGIAQFRQESTFFGLFLLSVDETY